jgi:hypothetical protein
MQELLKSDKIKPLLNRRQSRELVQNINTHVEERKEQIENIKQNPNAKLDKLDKVQKQQQLKDIFSNYEKAENINKEIQTKQISNQEETFKKRLEEKRMMNRGLSQPRLRLNVLFDYKIINNRPK